VNNALRFNSGKHQLSLVPPSLSYYTAAALSYGAVKYSPHNWRKGFNYTSIIDSLERHLLALKSGEDYDAESGLHNLALIAANTAFLIEHVEQGYGTDDRLKLGVIQPRRLEKPNQTPSGAANAGANSPRTSSPSSSKALGAIKRV
jgi:Domain of unknown function (DUF5664)